MFIGVWVLLRLNSVFAQLGLASYVKILVKENLIKKRLAFVAKVH